MINKLELFAADYCQHVSLTFASSAEVNINWSAHHDDKPDPQLLD